MESPFPADPGRSCTPVHQFGKVHADGATSYERIKGREYSGTMLEFAEKILYDLRRDPGHRVSTLEVASVAKQAQEDFRPVDDEAIYEVAIASFLVGGGDGFQMLNPSNLRHEFS